MDSRLDESTKNNDKVDDLKEPVFTFSFLNNLLLEYRHQGSYVYQAAAWVKVPYVRSAEEIELEVLLTHFAKNRQQDSLTPDEIIKLAKFSYKNPKHTLCSEVARLFHMINGTGRHYDILKLYLDKNLLTTDSLSFLFTSTPELRLSLYQFITAWNSDTIPLTLTIVEYAAFMLSIPEITSQQAILLLQALHNNNNLTLEKISTLANDYRKQVSILASSLEIVMSYNKIHSNHPTDIDFAFLDERLQTGQLPSDTPESLTLLGNNQLLTKNIVSHFGTPALLQRLREAQRLQEETLAKLQKNDEPVVITNTPPPPPPPPPTFKVTTSALLLKKKAGSSDKKPAEQKKAMPFLGELQERIKHLAKAEPLQKSSINDTGPLSIEEMLQKQIKKRNQDLQAPKEEPEEQPGLGW